MKKLIIYVLLALVISCSGTGQKSVISPYQYYGQYLQFLKAKDYDAAIDMLSAYNQKRFQSRNTQESFEEFFPFFSSVDSVVVKEFAHYQEVGKAKACLTVSGFNLAGEPASLNFELLNERSGWKFNYVHMAYHDSKNEFPKAAVCPEIL
ncbi:hypothetical protein SG34_031545 [Thalassomonas viridans]|uniref:DUF4878 domain-containing protein n=1 Tax=Thalassomonas viridans TaxID=137584 RepID=A0AAF0CDA6_9GAMM|nr:hypothetical protein [Thalassomonas viridans]WDE08460.1 hypothetical protein SG34_031545 [Thalassomonas viridans]